MTILITGGTGNTGFRLAQRLADANHPVLLTSRSASKVPAPFKGVTFDWVDASTHENPFNADTNIDRVYIVCPTSVEDMLGTTKPFLDLAVAKGVKRFVLLSAASMPKGGLAIGKVHEYIVQLGVDYCVLRPSWFIENFNLEFLHTLRDDNRIDSATKNGRIPLIAVDDIVDVAFSALVDEKSHNTDHIIVGPELFTYDEAAALFSDVLGRKIIHNHLSDEESLAYWLSFGMSKEWSEAMLETERVIAAGGEEAFFYEKIKVVGKIHLVDYIKANKEVWAPN